MANLLWDMMQARNMMPTLPTVEMYHKGLKVSFYFYTVKIMFFNSLQVRFKAYNLTVHTI